MGKSQSPTVGRPRRGSQDSDRGRRPQFAYGLASEHLADQFPELKGDKGKLAELVNEAMVFGDTKQPPDSRIGYLLLYGYTVVINDPRNPDNGTVVRPPVFGGTDMELLGGTVELRAAQLWRSFRRRIVRSSQDLANAN